MATLATGQPPPGVVQPPSNPSNTSPPLNLSQTNPQTLNPSYKSILHSNVQTTGNISIPAPTFDLHHGEPSFVWEDKIVDLMMRHEELHFAVIGKFSYGMPEFHELRKQIPLQCEIKGECLIGFLETRHVVIRLSCLEDYVHLLSRPAFSLKVGANLFPMRTMKYDVWFDPREETSIAVAWISFPGLPPAFFVKDAVFALASAVGKPLQLDAATKSKTRPSCAKVKVEVDLIATKPQRLRIGIKNSSNGEIRYKWIRIRYDFLPKFCKVCRLQGHNEEECFSLHPELVSVEEVKAKEDHLSKNETGKAAPFKVLQSGKIVGNVFKEGEGVTPVLTQGRQGKNSNKYSHPNRNPMAWTRVEKKTKQVTIDAACVNQGEPVATTNTFAMLDVNENYHELGKSAQPELDATVTQQSSKGVNDSTKVGDFLSPNSMQIGTRSWVQEVFKDHPKDVAVGVSIKSGSGKSRAVLNEMLESQKGIKDGGELDFVVCTAEGLINAQKGIQTPVVTQPSASPSEPVATDINENMEHQPSALICENVQHVNEAPAFKSQAASTVEETQVITKFKNGLIDVESRGEVGNVKIPSQKSCLSKRMSDGLLVGGSRGEVGICSDSRVSSCGVRQICSPTLIKNGSMIKAGRSRGEQLGSSCLEVARIHDAAFNQAVGATDVVNSGNIKAAALESTPSRLDLVPTSVNPIGHIEAEGVLNYGDSRGDLKIPSFLIPRHMSDSLLDSLKDAHTFGNAATLDIHSLASTACESASRDFNIVNPFHRGEHEDPSEHAEFRTACIEFNKLHAHGVVQLGNSRHVVSDSRGGHFNDGDDLIKQDGAHGNHYQSARGDNFLMLNESLPSASPIELNAAELSTPENKADRVNKNTPSENLDAFNALESRSKSLMRVESAPSLFLDDEFNTHSVSDDAIVSLSQRPCVENKQSLTIPSLEVSTSLQSESVTNPKFLENDLIPTVQLERLCKSSAPNFGKSFWNINAPSFVPKSLMQIVPQPTDDELVERMDLNDTRGILARQMKGSLQLRIPEGHYLVEDYDLFEEEELDEESTAHNFSIVAREGDLSPRENRDNAPTKVRTVRRPLEPTRVQPSRSTKSKSKRSKKSKK